ncbi:helix-turn-helix domain-containing protein [Kitasatospora sp. NPDC004614]|uniref:AraC family transcriptional regulator n=1 Tax=unclassified Kitasatospora TaxID=2633591 RepID=UPI00369BBB10
MRMDQGFSETDGEWQTVHALPETRLRGQVLGYRGYRLNLRRLRRRLEVPTDVLTVTFGFEGSLRLTDAVLGGPVVPLSSMVAGLRRTATVAEHSGSLSGVAVSLTPQAAYGVFGPAVAELGDQWVDIRQLLRRQERHLAEQLADADGWDARHALLDAFFVARLSAGHQWAPSVTTAWHEIRRTAGAVPVQQLAELTGWSRRRLELRFREQLGMPPKQVAQILRLQRTLAAFDASPGSSGAQIAAECGFYDQAHLDRAFRAMVGHTPRDFFRHRGRPTRAEPTDRLTGQVTSAVLAAGSARNTRGAGAPQR